MSQKTFLVPPNCRMLASTGRDLSHWDTVDLLLDLGKEGGRQMARDLSASNVSGALKFSSVEEPSMAKIGSLI